jgi:hypothetical protein
MRERAAAVEQTRNLNIERDDRVTYELTIPLDPPGVPVGEDACLGSGPVGTALAAFGGFLAGGFAAAGPGAATLGAATA